MITTERILRIITKSKYFLLKKDNIFETPRGLTFNIFFQLLCQDLNLYSTNRLQDIRVDLETKTKERNKLMVVHEELDKANFLFKKHKETFSPKEKYYLNEKTWFSVYKKHLRFFVEKVLLNKLLNIEKKTKIQ